MKLKSFCCVQTLSTLAGLCKWEALYVVLSRIYQDVESFYLRMACKGMNDADITVKPLV